MVFFLSASSLKLLNAVETGLVVEFEAELFEPHPEGVPTAVFAEDELGSVEADGLGGHDLVGALVFEDPVLMDAGLVGEGVGTHHRLVGRHRDSGETGHHVAGANDLGRVDPGVDPEVLTPGAQRHDDLFEAGITGALADSVDGHLHLACARPDGRETVGRGHPEIVVTVGGPDHVGASGCLGAKPADQLEIFIR